PLYERFGRLASPTLHQEVREAWAAAPEGPERARLRALAAFTARHLLEVGVAPLRDRLAAAEAAALLRVEGREIPLPDFEAALRDEPDRTMRGRMEAAHAEALRAVSPLRAEVLARIQDGAAALGYAGVAGLCRTLGPAGLEALAAQAQAILEQTEGMYEETLAWALRRHLHVRLKEARRHDLLRLFRASWLDPLFPERLLLPAAEVTLRALRLDLTAAGRIRLDLEERPGKAPRPFVAPSEVPDRIYLVARAASGLEAYEAFWRALGHALHCAHTDGNLPVEERRLGDASVAEVHASLLEGLVREAGWLTRFLEVGQPRDALWVAHLKLLGLLRRSAATLQHELLLPEGRNGEVRVEAYRYLLGQATAAEVSPELALADADPFCASAHTLRGWMGAALLADGLRERFDEDWYRNDRTGPFLRELWRQGLRPTLETLLQHLGLGPLTPEPLLRRITQDLQ
ncbi:MAG: hypothetical protein L0214_05245, partial [candidate division NC10 bacterium]|nr:hypothetical protein [candidate division NC10 bacterium]